MSDVSSATNAGSATKTSTSRATLSNNFETFLKLLTTQLQYQDPMQPMDTNEFTQQLVQYSQVEQQLSTNDKLDSLLALQKGQGVQSALGYLGWEVSMDTKSLPLQDSKGIFSVTAAEKPQNISIGISDANGKIVRGLTMTGAEFSHDGKLTQDVVWDGKDNNGNQLPDGTYTILVTATRADGSTIKTSMQTRGVVTGIDLDADGNTILKLGTMSLAPQSVKSIRAPSVIGDNNGGDTGTGTDTNTDGA